MVIGVVGGMGSYATLHFFKRYLEVFQAEKEWDRPRIIIDNRCTMPSRVRAVLYNEKYDDVVSELSDSIKRLMEAGCNRIVLACNTSHIFLEDVFVRLPDAKEIVLNIIDECARMIRQCEKLKRKTISLIATEGTIDSGIYQEVFAKYGLWVNTPSKSEYAQMREFIEVVKQDKIDEDCKGRFYKFIQSLEGDCIILGCTEFPVLYDEIKHELPSELKVIDPLEIILARLHREFIKEGN